MTAEPGTQASPDAGAVSPGDERISFETTATDAPAAGDAVSPEQPDTQTPQRQRGPDGRFLPRDAAPDATQPPAPTAEPQPQAQQPTQAQVNALQLEQRDGRWVTPDGRTFRPAEDYDRLQSELRQQAERERQRAEQAERQVAETRLAEQAQALQARQLSDVIAQLQGGADPEKLVTGLVQQQTTLTRNAYSIFQENERLKAQIAQIQGQTELTNSGRLADRLAVQYGVPAEDRSMLAQYAAALAQSNDPDRVQKLDGFAKRLGGLHSQISTQAKARRDEVPAGGEAQQFDTGSGRGALTDDQILADPNAPLADVERILAKRGIHPFR